MKTPCPSRPALAGLAARALRRGAGTALHACAILALLAVHSLPAAAQQDTTAARDTTLSRDTATTRDTVGARTDTAHVTYRTQEIVFLSAGRAAGLSVGDTVEVLGAAGAPKARALVVSVAQKTASATLIPADAPVAVGQVVRFTTRAPVMAAPAPVLAAAPPSEPALAAASDTTAAQAVAAAPYDTTPPPPPRPMVRNAQRWRGNVQLDQVINSVGGVSTVTSHQTSAAVALTAPVSPWLTLATRSTTFWRDVSTSLSAPGSTSQTMVYQLEARVAPPGSWWNLSLGRFVPVDAPGLGYIDGGRIEVQPSATQRIGLVGGYAPDLFTMAPSSAVRRAGAYWAVTTPTLASSVGGAAEWQDGARRRTWVSAQSYWTASSGLSFSFSTDLDYGSGWQAFRGFQLTDLSAGVRANLPYGFRGGLSVETNRSLRLWALAQMGDTLPLPGRLIGLTGSLGRQVSGSSVDLSASYLKRATDPSPTLRGTLTVFNPRFMIVAMGEHGDLFDFGSLMVRVPLPLPSTRLGAALGFGAYGTLLPGTSHPIWRTSVRPELSWRLGGGLYLSGSADLGRYAGQASTYVRVGVSYQLF